MQIAAQISGPTAAHCDADSRIELMPMGMHWPEIDEDISVASMLRGAKAPGARPPGQ